VIETWTPPLELDARPDRCRLSLVGVTYGNGATLQEAAGDLLVRLHDLALGLRRGGFRCTGEAGRLDPRVTGFLWEIGELVARGGDIRQRVFG
jgi:hypothetical protein